MRFWLDTEFIERPCVIDLLSIGVVAEDGREFYAENAYADHGNANDWVRENVLPHLRGGECAVPHGEIGPALRAFAGGRPEFWGYYADYDWVATCWLFGPMVALPEGWPMYCRDIKQWADDLGNPSLPEQESTEHNALADARWNRVAWEFLRNLETEGNGSQPAA